MAPRKKEQFAEHELSRRERQIMHAVYRLSEPTIADIVDNIPDPPTPDAVRRMCHILEDKGFLKSRADGPRKRYRPTVGGESARTNVLENLLDSFFAGSPHAMVAALLDARRDQFSKEEIRRLTKIIEDAEARDRGTRDA